MCHSNSLPWSRYQEKFDSYNGGTTGLSFEKRVLKIRLQAMEQHAQLRDYPDDKFIEGLKGDVKIDVFDFLPVAEFAEHAVMAARAAGEFSKAENDAPGLQLAINCYHGPGEIDEESKKCIMQDRNQ
ncbi:hypothetical protein Tco_1463252, partial [Tanacetum coccineum]